MNFLNGLNFYRGSSNPSPYGITSRHLRRIIWFWLHKVVGWGDIDKTGSAWDDTVATGSDGATDASDPWRFTSATGGLSFVEESFLVIHPTDATASVTGGFSDSTRNGFYKIANVINENTIILDPSQGVDLAGLPLGETGLAFSIITVHDYTDCPVDNDFFILSGKYSTSGSFHYRNREVYSVSYGGHYSQLSPYADWDNVAHAWNANNRVSQEVSLGHQTSNEHVTIYGGATDNYFWLYALHYNGNTVMESEIYFVGEFDAFHAVDVNPSILVIGRHASSPELYEPLSPCFGTNKDGSVPLSFRTRYMCKHEDTDAYVQNVGAVRNTRYSGRRAHVPLIISSESVGYEALRGELPFKSAASYESSGRQVGVVGSSKQSIRIANIAFSWNGSDIRQFFPGV